jgi:acetyl esterase/lipase
MAFSDRGADAVLSATLAGAFGEDYALRVRHPAEVDPEPPLPGILETARLYRRYTAGTSDIGYGPHGTANTLDVWRGPGRTEAAPVLLQIHGGAWMVGSKRGQAHSLLGAMVTRGWVCVSINYRKSPRYAWPAQLVDVKRAIAWVREHAAEFGGDPSFIAVTGGSAGGHLSALAALTSNDPSLQPGFENADTAVQAAVPFYGVYDVTGPVALQPLMAPFLEEFVMQSPRTAQPDVFTSASPRLMVRAEAPPFLIVHGASDSFIPVAQARAFHEAMVLAGARGLGYAELPRTEHAFDTFGTVRTQRVIDKVAQYLGLAYGEHCAGAAGPRSETG